ncbi:MAG: phosphatase PAP2 family protein [Acidimicrobiia bacterium]|nr:phosphatase PAP2 family protein [Acidimicrobiia bacterium]
MQTVQPASERLIQETETPGRAIVGRWTAAISVIVLIWIYLWIRYTGPEFAGLDASILALGDRGRLPGSGSVLAAISLATDSVSLGLATGLVAIGLAVAFSYRRAVLFLAMATSSAVIVTILKSVVGRIRPPLGASSLGSLAWPSGHSAGAMTFALAAAIALHHIGRKSGLITAIILVPAALLVGYSRIFLSVHWMTDVVAGWAVSLLAVGFGLAIETKIDNSPRSRPAAAYGAVLLAVSLMVTIGMSWVHV